MSPPYTVILYPVNSQLRYLVITTLDSIYGKKKSHTVSACVLFTPHRSATTPCGHHNNQSFPAFPFEHKLNPYGVFFVDITAHSDALIIATKCSADTAGVEKAKQKNSNLTLKVKLDIFQRCRRQCVCRF